VRVRFGECIFDSGTRELLRKGHAVEISPKALALLEALLDSRPRALGKAELHARLWPDAHVAGTSLPRLINEIRGAIGDGAAEHRFIRTVQRFGYAFCGLVLEVPGAAPLRADCWLAWGPDRIPVPQGDNPLGRGEDSLVALTETRVSRRHAHIVVFHGLATLEDLGSRNGTYLNGRKIEGPVTLRSGDRIGIGSAQLLFVMAAPEPGCITEGDL
jgi:DNA-binding winged helix-turn-helix (wHTH) protein